LLIGVQIATAETGNWPPIVGLKEEARPAGEVGLTGETDRPLSVFTVERSVAPPLWKFQLDAERVFV